MATQQARVRGAIATGETLRSPHRGEPREPRPRRRGVTVLTAATLVCASTLVLHTTPALALAGPDTTPGSPQAMSRVEKGLSPRLNEVVAAGVPGVIVRVQDRRETRLAAAGVADLATGAALRPQARFRVASITKTFVATVVLQLVGEGRLSLDEPVGRRLPGLLANGKIITVRQLLNHTSGLFNYTDDPTVFQGMLNNRSSTPKEQVAIAETHPSSAPPGTAWAYSNTNYIVAGLLVEAVTRHSLGQELRRRIFDPLGLRDTSFPGASTRIPGYHAHGYVSIHIVPTPDGRPLDVTELNTSAWADGAIISNATDISRFYRALMTGRLLTPYLLREMKTTVPQDPADPHQFRYGLGIERVQDTCGANWGHGGSIFGYQDTAYWNDKTDRTVVIASTMSPAPAAADTALSNLTDFALCGMPPLRHQ